jgi:hypothetical protein
MIEKFLKAKHWQVFIITFGLPFFIQIMLMPIIILTNNPMILLRIFPITMILFIGGFFGWFWSIAIGLQQVIPKQIQLNVNSFKVFLLIPLVYFILFLAFFITSFNSGIVNSGMLALIVPLHFFSIFSILYCVYFAAKTFKTAELQRNVTFSDFAGEFFLIWFFPIGIWIIQPKINLMIENKDTNHNYSVGLDAGC